MAPKKGTKMSLSSFLEDSTLGSWADEMESLPTAPAPKTDEERARGDYGRRDRDFLSTRPDRAQLPPREDVPLPTQPPYTAFVGNLAFDLTEEELGSYFGSHPTKSIKIIKDHAGKPKGFGYIEFEGLEGLKEAIAKSGSTFSNRTIRVSVAEPPKERIGGGGFDDEKFSGNWRRDGPLPSSDGGPSGGRRRYDGLSSGMTSQDTPSPASDTANDWRSSSRGPRVLSEPDPSSRRKGSGFSTPDGQASAADLEETWVIGAKFKPSQASGDSSMGSRFGSMRAKGDMGPPASIPADDGDWRTSARPRTSGGRNSTSPSNSQPPTPQMNRRKLELLPRSTSVSAAQSPIGSPKSATSPSLSSSRANPFGTARPVDVTARENAVAEKIEKEREVVKERMSHAHTPSQSNTHSMSRQNSRQARERPSQRSNDESRTKTPPNQTTTVATPSTPSSPKGLSAAVSATIRPAVSFANAAAAVRKDAASPALNETIPKVVDEETIVEEIVEQVNEINIAA